MKELIPIGILGALTFLGIGIALVEHGKPKTGKHNVWINLVAWIIQWALILWTLLWW